MPNLKRRSLFVLVQKHRSVDELEEKMKTLQIEGKNCSALGTLFLPVGELPVLPQSGLGDLPEPGSLPGACCRLHTWYCLSEQIYALYSHLLPGFSGVVQNIIS